MDVREQVLDLRRIQHTRLYPGHHARLWSAVRDAIAHLCIAVTGHEHVLRITPIGRRVASELHATAAVRFVAGDAFRDVELLASRFIARPRARHRAGSARGSRRRRRGGAGHRG